MKAPKIRFDVITLFPEAVSAALDCGVVGRAIDSGQVALRAHQLRDHTGGSPHPVDDHPYGGGPGMVMRPEPIHRAVEELSKSARHDRRILLTPQGARFDQATARRLASLSSVLLLCGRYEGVDERVRGLFDEELSIGDYVISGGEPAAVVVIDAIARLVPGVLGSADSLTNESFGQDLLEYPQYTRPEDFKGDKVPPVLLSGDHARIDAWRREQAQERTRRRRPDLLGRNEGD